MIALLVAYIAPNIDDHERRYESEGVRLSYLSSRVFGAIAGIEEHLALEDLLARPHANYTLRTLTKRGLIDGSRELTERGERFASRVYLPLSSFPTEPVQQVFAFGDSRLPRRFWLKTIPEPMSGCWLWIARCYAHGYGAFGVSGDVWRAHRVSYLMLIGPISDGLELDHKCRQPTCVNPAHLEAVTHSVNIQRWWDSPEGLQERLRRER